MVTETRGRGTFSSHVVLKRYVLFSAVILVVLLLTGATHARAQTQQEQLIVDEIGSSAAVGLATSYMSVSERAARDVSSDLAIPGPGMLDVDPLSTRGEWAVNYETRDFEMCRAATATAIAAVIENYSSGEWVISTSCINSMVEVHLNLEEGTARADQWQGPDGYIWQDSWGF